MRISKLMQTILLSTGGGSIVTLFVSFFFDKLARLEFFRAMIFGMIFVGIVSWLLFEEKIISPDIWLRRFLSIVFDYFIMLSSMLLFGVFTPTPLRLFIHISVGLGGSFLFGIPLWYFVDRTEKKQLEKINAKLEKNE